MKNSEKYRLGSVVTASVAESLLQDKETRDLVRDSAVKTVEKGANILGTTFKILGITIGAGILFLVGRKIVKSIKKNSAVRQETKDIDKNNLSKDIDFNVIATDIYKSFDPESSFVADYDETTIKRVLSMLKNVDDWKELIRVFGTREMKSGFTTKQLSLKEFLRADDESDVKSYNKILEAIGVPQSNLI